MKIPRANWRFWGSLIVLCALIPSAYLAWTWRSMPHFGAHYDDGVYFVTAKSWADGTGHRIVSMPGEPLQTKYPPVYPILLSMVWRVCPGFPANLPVAMAFSWIALPLLALAAWRYYESLGLGIFTASLLTAFLALTPVITTFSLFLMSELLFTALLVGAVLIADRSVLSGSIRLAALAGLVAALAYLTRAAALPLLGTVTLCYLLRRQWRQAVAFASVMAPVVLAWQWWVRMHLPESNDVITLYHTNYAGFHFLNVNWETLPSILLANLNAMLAGVGALFFFSEAPSLWVVTLQRIATVGAIAGCFRLARRTRLLNYPLYAVAYGLILIQWHYPPKERFLIPLAPLLLAGLLTEARHLFAAVRKNLNHPRLGERLAAISIGAGLIGLGAFAVWQARQGHSEFLPRYFAHQESLRVERGAAYRWVSEHSSPETQYFADKDAAFYLYTGHRACSLRIPPVLIVTNNQDGVRELLFSLPRFSKQFHLDRAFLTQYDFNLEAHQLGGEVLGQLFADRTRFPLLHRSGSNSVYEFPSMAGHLTKRAAGARPNAPPVPIQ